MDDKTSRRLVLSEAKDLPSGTFFVLILNIPPKYINKDNLCFNEGRKWCNDIVLRQVTVRYPDCASKVPPGKDCYACGKPLPA